VSVTGFWILTTVADEQITAWRERYADELAAAADGREKALAWWQALGDEAFLRPLSDGRWQKTEAGFAFADLFWEGVPDELAHEVMAAADPAGDSGRSVTAARKGAPAAALYQALGAADGARMPGFLGDFLIAADEIAVVLPEVERILGGARRADVVERAGRWLQYAADDAASDAPEIVDGLLRVLRRAAEQGMGAAAVSMTY
jgi:hypothetical protein